MPSPVNVKKGTNQFMRQGHTSAPVLGTDPQITASGKMGQTPKELKP